MKKQYSLVNSWSIVLLLFITSVAIGLNPEWVTETNFSACFYEIKETPDNNLVISGSFEGRPCLYLCDMEGDTLWTCLPDSNETSTGALVWVEIVPDGYITCGALIPQGEDKNTIFALIDLEGNLIWEQVFDFEEENQDAARCIIQGSDGDYYFTGYVFYIGNIYRALSGRLSSSGELIWTDMWGNPNHCKGVSIVENPYGELAVITQAGRPHLLVYTKMGDIVLSRYYSTLPVTPPAGLVVDSEGYTFTTFFYGRICRADLFGVLKWTITIADQLNCLKHTWDAGYIAAGFTFDRENTGKDVLLTYEGWISKLNTDGVTEWYNHYIDPGGRSLEYKGVIKHSSGGYIAAGYVSNHGFLAYYAPEEGIQETDDQQTTVLSCSPSPFSSQLTISVTSLEPSDFHVSIFDTAGRTVESFNSCFTATGEQTILWKPENSIPNGCYILQLETENPVPVLRRRIILLR